MIRCLFLIGLVALSTSLFSQRQCGSAAAEAQFTSKYGVRSVSAGLLSKKLQGLVGPLMVVDGIVTDYGNLLTMNPDEIVSIDVIRPSEFSQAYFCREPAPVVVVTTRSSLRKTFLIKDILTGEKIPAATILLTSGSDSLQAVADGEGRFTTEPCQPGKQYRLTVSSAGYRTFSGDVSTRVKEQEVLLERDFRECAPVVVVSSVITCVRVVRCLIGSVRTAKDSTAKEAVKNDGNLRIYPNPALRNTTITIDAGNKDNAPAWVQVYTATGQLAGQVTCQPMGNGLYQFPADSRWTPGTYAVRFCTAAGRIPGKTKLILQ